MGDKDIYKKGFKKALLRNLSLAIVIPFLNLLMSLDDSDSFEILTYKFKLFLIAVFAFSVIIFVITYIYWIVYLDK